MAGGMEKLDLQLADLENIAGLDLDQVRVAQAGNALDALGFILVHIDFGLDSADHLGGALNILPHHVSTDMVLMVMSNQNLFEVVTFALRIVDDSVNVPCGI